MSELLTSRSVQCPYCWQPIELIVDRSAGDQSYVEDCQVCCRPMLIRARGRGENGIDIDIERAD